MKNKKILGIERILRKRNFGGIIFINIIHKKKPIQIIAKKKNIKNFKKISRKIKIGDYIYFKGIYVINKKGILCINIKLIKIIIKNKLLVPDKKKNIKNKKIKYTKRYFELFFNKKSIKKINIRNKFIKNLRVYMNKKKFIEIETPILNKTKGSAEAKSFITKSKSLKKNMYLRISPEIYMKKSLIIGYKKIFEIGKNFRNEGISKNHYPEFSFMEYYSVLTNYKWSMKFLEKMLKVNIFLLTKKKYLEYKKKKIFYLKKFKKITIKKIIIEFFPNIKKKINSTKYFKNKVKKYIKEKNENKINNIEFLRYIFFEKKISKKIIWPTFVKHFPIIESPLAKKTKNNNNIAERFELYFCGKEIANGYSELNIAKEQKKRFLKQKNNLKNIDKLFIEYLKFGMLPSSGCGIGIDRILMIITNSRNIKETIMFPEIK